MDSADIRPDETGFDSVVAFSLRERDVRGRCVRLGPVLDTILSAHDYPGPIRHLLAEGLRAQRLYSRLPSLEKHHVPAKHHC